MSPLRLGEQDAAALRALVLLQRYTRGLNRVTDQWLGDQGSDNNDVQILLAVQASLGAGPSTLVTTLGMPRSTLARGVARLLERQLVERRVDQVDHRRAGLYLTRTGEQAVTRLEHALADFFGESEPMVKEIILLLGGDPEPAPGELGLPVLDIVARMSAAGAAYGRDMLPRMRAGFATSETADRWALMILAEAWARPSSLADQLGLSPAGTTSMLERLEASGLVVRESGGLDSDRRAVVVHLTPRGRRAARMLLGVFRTHADAMVGALRPTLAFACPAGDVSRSA
jgi:DNA-binding MarR family transcriptional regulator